MRATPNGRALMRVVCCVCAVLVPVACQATAKTGTAQLVTREMEPLMQPDTPTPASPEALPPLDRSRPPEPGEPRPYVLPAVTQRMLDNGLMVLLVDRPGFPTVSARLSLRAGRDESGGNVAIPLLTGRALRDGTATRSAEALADYIDSHGIDFNVGVATNQVRLGADVLSSKLDEALALFAELVTQATYPDERIASRKDELIAELVVARAQPSFHRDRLMRRVAFGEHPYAVFQPTPEQVAEVTPEALRAFYEGHYGPARAQLVIVGDLPDDLDALLARTLGTWTRDVTPYEPPPPIELSTCNHAHVVLRDDSAQTSIQWVGPGISPRADEYLAAVAANQVLGGGASARLFLNLRQDKSYTYGAYSGLSDLLGTAWFTASSDVRSAVTAPALGEFVGEFERLRSEPLPGSELGDAKQYLSGVFPLQLETNAALASRLSELVDIGLGVRFLEEYRDRVEAVDVSAAQAAGARLVQREQLALVMVGEEDVVVPAARSFASRVYVYDLDGNLLREEPGELPSSCP
jgi:zinc protease